MRWNTNNQEVANKINGGYEYENGDVLDARSLNAIVKEVLLISNYFGEDMGREILEYTFPHLNWTQERGNPKTERFSIKMGKQKVYVKEDPNMSSLGKYQISSEYDNENHVIVKVSESTSLNNHNYEGSLQTIFSINFYLDSEYQNLLTTKKIAIDYTYSPSGSND